MDKFMDLGTLVLLVMILAGIINIIYRAYKAKKDDGIVDDDEKEDLFQQIRTMAFNLVVEALEIQRREKQGNTFVREYIISKLTIAINESTLLNQEEKELVITYLLEQAVDTVLQLLGYNVTEIKTGAAKSYIADLFNRDNVSHKDSITE